MREEKLLFHQSSTNSKNSNHRILDDKPISLSGEVSSKSRFMGILDMMKLFLGGPMIEMAETSITMWTASFVIDTI